ncbi:hypothetical protein MRX96_045374 [Rhipicephalus microplus]
MVVWRYDICGLLCVCSTLWIDYLCRLCHRRVDGHSDDVLKSLGSIQCGLLQHHRVLDTDGTYQSGVLGPRNCPSTSDELRFFGCVEG